MKITDALKSGKRFKLPCMDRYYDGPSWLKRYMYNTCMDEGNQASLLDDLSSEGWELEPVSITITSDHFETAWNQAVALSQGSPSYTRLRKLLGFT